MGDSFPSLGVSESKTSPAVGSARWAALGDALGWITELTDRAGVKRRIGSESVSQPVQWNRRIFSQGPTVALRAGTYSDDTQLRLAVCRATRADGIFDVEAFAKLELPIWLSYSLGAGLGTTAAASNLTKSSVNWFTNFFTSRNQNYFKAGGNGAAMRVQPHVWKNNGDAFSLFLVDVLKDALVTHGHIHGFGGAIFHAVCLRIAIQRREIPGPDDWVKGIDAIDEVMEIVAGDNLLERVWLPTWEDESNKKLKDEVRETKKFMKEKVNLLKNISRTEQYPEVIDALKLRDSQFRGSGLLTALAASVLCWLHRNQSNETALMAAANALGSDTDTIGSMAGAILGAVRPDEKTDWPLQDSDYILGEAERISMAGNGGAKFNFVYPDLMSWKVPTSQSDSVGVLDDGRFAIKGLGVAEAIGKEWAKGDFCWQWMKLSYGQTVLAKRRKKGKLPMFSPSQLPGGNGYKESNSRGNDVRLRASTIQGRLFAGAATSAQKSTYVIKPPSGASLNLDEITGQVIRGNFDPADIGRGFLEVLDQGRSIEPVIGYASIVAKAILARQKKQHSN